MSDALYRAILADPDSDGPRIRYAESARTSGDPRADLIDAQLEVARQRRAHQPMTAYRQAHDRAAALIDKHGALWRQPLAPLIDDGVITRPTFLRGFVEDVTMTAATFAKRARDVYALAPVRHLSLTDVAGNLDALRHLDRIVSLDISGQQLGDDAITALAGSAASRRLHWLDISVNQITEAGLAALVASPHLPALAYVSVRGNRFASPVDEHGSEGDSMVMTRPSDTGKALEAKLGHRVAWFHAPYEFGDSYPPMPEGAVDP